MMTLPQFCRLIPSGVMKSFSCEVKESDDRLLIRADPKLTHLPVWKISRRSICASPKVRADLDPVVMSPSDSAAGIVLLLIVPTAHGLLPHSGLFVLRVVAGPQADPPQSRFVMAAREPPWSIAYSRR